MKIRFIASIAILAVLLLGCTLVCTNAAKPAKLNVLFMVGGADFHDPVNLPPIMKKVAEDTGIFAVTITQDHDQFKPENIKNYDLVMIYTTGGNLSKDQEKGLTDFVANGKGLVGIHSATDSFKNSDAYWKMVGGRFTGHNSGTFDVKITGKSHCIVQGMKDFKITDESYCDAFHPDSKCITLMRRPMDSEPASWVQYYGKGRVFVTGLGHGKEAWENKSFQEMVLRSMLWSCGKLNP